MFVELSLYNEKSLCFSVYHIFSESIFLCSSVFHYIVSADKPYVTFRIFVTCAPYHSPPYYVLFFSLTACPLIPPFFLLFPPCAVPFRNSCNSTFLFPVFFPFAPLSHAITSCLSPLASCPPAPCFCVWQLLPQRVVKTPSAVPAVPVCPASTATPKRLSPHCSSESPMRARVTPCPPHVCGWEPA